MKAFILFFLFSLSLVGASGQSPKIDSLKNLIKVAETDTNRVNTLNVLCKQLYMSGSFDSALVYGEKAKALAKSLSFKKGMAAAITNMGLIYYFGGNYSKAVEYDFEALAIYQGLEDKVGIAANFSHIGILYGYEGNYPKAVEYLLKALAIEQEINDKVGSANTFIDIGEVYYEQGNCKNALEYMFKGLEMSEKNGNKNVSAHVLSSIGSTYEALSDYSDALKYHLKALALFQETGYENGITISLVNIGSTYEKQGNYTSARESDQKALTIAKKTGAKRAIILSYEVLGILDTKEKKYKEAKMYLDSALVISKAEKIKNMVSNTYGQLSQLDSSKGDYSSAVEDYKNYFIYRDSVISENNAKKTLQVEMNYEFEQKQAAEKSEQDSKEAARHMEEIKHKAQSKIQKVLIGLIASIAGILVLLVILIFQRMKNVEKKKLIAEQQKSWLELKALRTQMNPHFLYNTINSIQSFVLKNDTKSSVNYLAQFASLMRGVLENSRKDKVTLADEIDGLYNYLDFEIMRFPAKFKYQIKVDDGLDKAKTLLPPLLIQPYVENAIWHGLMHLKDVGGCVIISFERVNGHIKCTIDDNGIGRKASNDIKNKSVHKSLGMSIVAERMESMNRMYHWDMKIGIVDKFNEDGTSAGTKVELYLPLILNTVVYD